MIKDKVCEIVGNTSFEALGNGLTQSKYIDHVASSVQLPTKSIQNSTGTQKIACGGWKSSNVSKSEWFLVWRQDFLKGEGRENTGILWRYEPPRSRFGRKEHFPYWPSAVSDSQGVVSVCVVLVRLSVPETLTADSHKNKSKWEIPFVFIGYIAQNRSVCDAQKTQTPSSCTWSTAPKSPWSALIIFWLPQIFTSPLSTRLSSDFPPPLFE